MIDYYKKYRKYKYKYLILNDLIGGYNYSLIFKGIQELERFCEVRFNRLIDPDPLPKYIYISYNTPSGVHKIGSNGDITKFSDCNINIKLENGDYKIIIFPDDKIFTPATHIDDYRFCLLAIKKILAIEYNKLNSDNLEKIKKLNDFTLNEYINRKQQYIISWD